MPDREENEVKNEMKIGSIIAKYRKKAKLTQQQLADKLGVNKGTIYQYEKDKLMPRYNRLQEIVTLLDIPESAFYGVILPPAAYTEEDIEEIMRQRDADVALYSFLEHMGVDVKAFFYTNKQHPKMLVQYNGAGYVMDNGKREAFYEAVKDYAVYLLEKNLRDCRRVDSYPVEPPLASPEEEQLHHLKKKSQLVNNVTIARENVEARARQWLEEGADVEITIEKKEKNNKATNDCNDQ